MDEVPVVTAKRKRVQVRGRSLPLKGLVGGMCCMLTLSVWRKEQVSVST